MPPACPPRPWRASPISMTAFGAFPRSAPPFRELLPPPHPPRCLSAASAPGSDPDDLWIAKVVSAIFRRAPTHAVAVAHSPPFGLGVVHLPQTFTFLISCLCRSGLHEDAVKLFEEMARDGHTVDGSFVEFLANSCFEAGKLDLATGFLAAVSKYGCRFQSYTFNKVLTSLVRRDPAGDAVVFLRQHLGCQFLTVDTCSFNIIIKGLCRIGDLDTALEFFNQMQSFCCVPDIVTYNILIDGLCKADQVDCGRKILQKIQLDSACVPNVVTFTSIISGYCKVGKMEET